MSAQLASVLALRPMQLADLDAVQAIEASCYTHPWSRGNFIDSLAAGYLAQVMASPADGPVGYVVAMAGAGEMHLLNVSVAPGWQGQGHGSRLLDAVQAAARADGMATLWLEVRVGNERAQALYRRRGFVQVGLRRGYYPARGGREDAVVMSLVLPRTGGAPHAVD